MRDDLLLRLLLSDEFTEAEEQLDRQTELDPEAVKNFWVQFTQYLNDHHSKIKTKDSNGNTIVSQIAFVLGEEGRVKIDNGNITLPITIVKGQENLSKISTLLNNLNKLAKDVKTPGLMGYAKMG